MSAYAHPVASVYANVYADGHNTCLTYTPAHAWWSQHLSECMHALRKKCAFTCPCAPMHRCRRFFAMKATANSSWVLSEHRAGCRLPPALPAVSTKSVARRCSLKKSVQIHASSWRVAAADFSPVYMWSRSPQQKKTKVSIAFCVFIRSWLVIWTWEMNVLASCWLLRASSCCVAA